MGRREETSISLASTTPNSKIIDQAFASSAPVKPNKRSIQLLAILVGIGLPALFIFMLEVVNDKVSTRYDIEKITPAPILGEIGHSYADTSLVVNKTNRGMVAEQFRIIRSNLQYVLNKIEKPVILVTSSFSGEGKSFVTTNLGAVLALAGKKTVIIEFDIRKPKIITGLGLSKRSGVTNYILGKADIEDLPVLVPGYDNLFVISCGPVPPNPSELLLESRVDELFKRLNEIFDVILIDTAPVGMVSDGLSSGEVADVLQLPEDTVRKQLSRGIDRLRATLAPTGAALSLTAILSTLAVETAPSTLTASLAGIASGSAPVVAAIKAGAIAKVAAFSAAAMTIVSTVTILWWGEVHTDQRPPEFAEHPLIALGTLMPFEL